MSAKKYVLYVTLFQEIKNVLKTTVVETNNVFLFIFTFRLSQKTLYFDVHDFSLGHTATSEISYKSYRCLSWKIEFSL